MSVSEDRKIIILKSLQHYSDIVASLLAEKGIPEIVKFDLNNEYVKLYKVQSIVQTKGISQKINESHSVLEIGENAKVVCSALTSYIKDLERSISEIDSLYGDKTIPLDFAIKDKQLAKETFDEVSKIQTI
jgi:Glu-tRNA(Gln) amidotransferase subunit E-like FAD-binding protein